MALANSTTPLAQASPSQASQLQLHDIHVPEQVSNFPIAPGWWLLLVLSVICAIVFYKKYNKNKRLNADKNRALITLDNNPSLSSKECISLLKWAAMQYFSRQQLAKMYGQGFQTFLTNQLPEKHQNEFTTLTNAAFQMQYQGEKSANAEVNLNCQQATKLWLTQALPPNRAVEQVINQTENTDNTMPSEILSEANKPVSAERFSAPDKSADAESKKELSA